MTKKLRLENGASFARNLAPDYCRFNAVHMNITNTMKKKKQKGHSNGLRTTVIRQKEPRYPQHIPSFFSRFSLQPPFAEVLSSVLRAAYWPLVFTFSGLFWPGPFFPIFRQWIPKRCKGVHCVDLGESFPTSIYSQKSASVQPRTSPSKFGGKYSILINRVLSGASASRSGA